MDITGEYPDWAIWFVVVIDYEAEVVVVVAVVGDEESTSNTLQFERGKPVA